MMLPQFYMDDLIRQAIREDINYIDTSADYLIPPDQMGKARFLAKADGVLCGLSVALRVFELLDPAFRAQRFHADGDTLQKGRYHRRAQRQHRHVAQGRAHRAQPHPAYVRHRHSHGAGSPAGGGHARLNYRYPQNTAWPSLPAKNMQSSAAAVKTTVTTSPTARCSRITTLMPPVASPTRSLFCVESLAIW